MLGQILQWTAKFCGLQTLHLHGCLKPLVESSRSCIVGRVQGGQTKGFFTSSQPDRFLIAQLLRSLMFRTRGAGLVRLSSGGWVKTGVPPVWGWAKTTSLERCLPEGSFFSCRLSNHLSYKSTVQTLGLYNNPPFDLYVGGPNGVARSM